MARITQKAARADEERACAKEEKNDAREDAAATQAYRVTNATEETLRLARSQADVAFAQAILTALAVVFTGWAAWAAADAARAAKISVEDARADSSEQADRFERQFSIAKQSADAAMAAANAANAQIEIAKKAFTLENRPWVGIIGEGVGTLEIKEDGVAKVSISSILQNSGRTPAHDVEFQVRLILEKRPEGTVIDLMNRVRHASRSVELDAVTCLFPNEKRTVEYSIESLPLDDIVNGGNDGDLSMIFTLCGYVLYRSDSVEAGNMHASSFVYRIAKKDNRHIIWGGRATIIDGFDLQMKRWPGGWMAD